MASDHTSNGGGLDSEIATLMKAEATGGLPRTKAGALFAEAEAAGWRPGPSVLTDDEEASLALVNQVRTCIHEEAKARAAVNAALTGDTTPEEREAAGVMHRDAQRATADARVALVEHAARGAV